MDDTSQSNGAHLDFEIDTINTISGSKTAHIMINKQGERPADGFLKWKFRAEKGEMMTIRFKARAKVSTEIKCRLEDSNHINDKPINEDVMLSTEIREYTFTSTPLKNGSAYQLVFYMGLSEGEIWIDDVRLQ